MSSKAHLAGVGSRIAALGLLHHVLDRRQTLDEAFAAVPAAASLSAQDRAFVMLMVKTALRRLGQTEALLTGWMERPLPLTLRPLHRLLQLGLTQLLWLDVPAHAAVHATVEAAKESGYARQAKLVNALLQRGVREGAALVRAQDAARLNTPDWLWESWAEAYGEDGARAIAAMHLQEPPLDISVKDDAAGWAERFSLFPSPCQGEDQGGGPFLTSAHEDGKGPPPNPLPGRGRAQVLPGGTVRILNHSGPITELPGFDDGAWWVQDAAAALPARLLLEALGDAKGKRVADLCAAPGGKTAQLIAAGAKVTALDIDKPRMKRMVENLARLGMKAECMVTDAGKWEPAEPFDAVLLDAPCSATGTIRRHPEIAWVRHPKDVLRLAALQRRLLSQAAGLVRPGGVLVYAVCSVQPEEGAQQVDLFVKNHGEFRAVSRYTHASLNALIGGEGDGFYVAVMERIAI